MSKLCRSVHRLKAQTRIAAVIGFIPLMTPIFGHAQDLQAVDPELRPAQIATPNTAPATPVTSRTAPATIAATTIAATPTTAATPATPPSEEVTANAALAEAEFDSAFLIGDAQQVDISRFKYGNPVLPGEYNVDVYVNDQWFGKRRMLFKATQNTQNAQTCFSAAQMLEYGVKKDSLALLKDAKSEPCALIEQWVDQAFYAFDSARLRVDISIPQVALQHNAQGYVDPSVWDRGVNAGFLSYNGSMYQVFNQGQQADTRNAFMSLSAGANLGGWQLRHQGQWQWQDAPNAGQASSSYTANSTYLQRALPQYRGMLTLGERMTEGEVFDSFGYRGVDFSSDDRMLPNSMLGYAPRIRGHAKTNAKVEVRQKNQVVYQTTVAAGNFEINDLYPTGFGDALEVSVIEATGEIQKFSIPYAAVVQMLRPGLSRYSATVGQYHEQGIDLHPWIAQLKYQRGINNLLTGYSGLQASEDYTAAVLGAAVSTPIGAISLDVTHAQAQFEQHPTQSGQSYKISYSKLISPTHTNLTLAAYRYSTENYFSLRNAMQLRADEKNGINSPMLGQQRSEFQITLNQGLPRGWGNLSLVGSWTEYWNLSQSNQQFQLGYSNQFRNLTYGLSVTQREMEYASQTRSKDTEYLLTLSLPLSFKKQSMNFNASLNDNQQTLGMNATLNDRFSYGASVAQQDANNTSFNSNARYRSNYATVAGSYSWADQYQQANLSISGNVVAHAHGVVFGAEQGQTMVLVYAPDAAGAKVNNTAGLSINKAGYAVIPYVTPYRLNDITLDPQNMSSRVELEQTSQRVAPFAGAISKVDFSTKTGYAVYIDTHTQNGGNLPFAAEVYDQHDQVVGIVAQGSMIYLRTARLQDRLSIRWREDVTQQCNIAYDVTDQAKNTQQNYLMTQATCE